jgi:hypothetical protein
MPAIYSAVAAFPNGMWLSTFARFCGSSVQLLFSGVTTAPGATELIRIPRSANSRADVFVRFPSPLLLTE